MFKPKICIVCGNEFIPKSGVAKVCPTCHDIYRKQQQHEYHVKNYKQKHEKKWDMPKGKDSPFYKTGISLFKEIAFANYPAVCDLCGSTENLVVHHKDHNRKNNDVCNLQIVCKSCHQKIHHAADHLLTEECKEVTRQKAKDYQLQHPKKRDANGRFIPLN